jgi:hypothetical protein
MDPYIEVSHLWEDFHHDLIGEIKGSLAGRLPDRYVLRAGERSYVAVTLDDEEERSWLPDVAVASRPSPVMMRALVKAEYREPFLEIRQVEPEHKLVTAIEILSPSNKRANTKGWRLYYRKRLAFLSGHANFVEIDLLRRGRRMPMVSRWPDSPYYLLVCRKKQAPRCAVWPAYFYEPLPPIPIPLLPPDADIMLDLQPLVAAIYTRSRYERDIDYGQPLQPPLSSDEAAWLEEQLREERK